MSDCSGRSLSSRLLVVLLTALVTTALASQGPGFWADFQVANAVIGNPSRRIDFAELHAGVCAPGELAPGIGIGSSFIRAIGPTWKTGISCWGVFPLDVKAVFPLSVPHDKNVLLSLRLNGTAMFWGASTNKIAGLASARWYGAGVGLDFSPEFDVGGGFNGGVEFGWLRAQNLFRHQDDAVWYWGIRVGWGQALIKYGD